MPRIQQFETSTGSVHYITIPKAIIKLKGWGAGDVLDFVEKDGDVVVILTSKRTRYK